jgi:hypothetical protein
LSIIGRGQTRIFDGYTERHHIVPRSLGGSNSASNISKLTAREHFIVHLLLVKITKGPELRKMCYALHKMMYGATKRFSHVYYKSLSFASKAYRGGLNNSPCSEKKRIANKANGIRIWKDPNTREKIIASMKKTAATPERKRAFVEAALKTSTPEVNAKKSESAKKRRWSDEVKKKMSESRKALYADPAKREAAISKSLATRSKIST